MPFVQNYNDDLRLAHVMADSVDDQTMSRFKALDLKVETKPDLTPVTDADKAAEDAIRGQLSRARPRDAVLGEEFGSTGSGPRRWVIDPIDGTMNFVRQFNHSCISVAYMSHGVLRAAAIYNPYVDEMFTAVLGQGAKLNGSPIRAAIRTAGFM